MDYSSQWNQIFNLSIHEINQIQLDSLNEENLDALSIRLKQLGENYIPIYESMIQTSLQNSAVEYTNIFEKVIIYQMNQENYQKVILILQNYLKFDQKQRDNYRNHFIRRNLGICYVFLGFPKKGHLIIQDLILESPLNFWNYHDLAFEFYSKNQIENTLKYLSIGIKQAKKSSNDFWYHLLYTIKKSINIT